jgi:hypothetical protein
MSHISPDRSPVNTALTNGFSNLLQSLKAVLFLNYNAQSKTEKQQTMFQINFLTENYLNVMNIKRTSVK